MVRFGHADHVRLAWIILRNHEFTDAQPIIRDGIEEFAEDQGAPDKFHQTLTIFWTRMIHHAIQSAGGIQDLKSLLRRFPFLADSKLPLRHWKDRTLWSTDARKEWVEPDLSPLPF